MPWLCGLQKKDGTERKKCSPHLPLADASIFLGVYGLERQTQLPDRGQPWWVGGGASEAGWGVPTSCQSPNNSSCFRMGVPGPVHFEAPSRSLSPGFCVSLWSPLGSSKTLTSLQSSSESGCTVWISPRVRPFLSACRRGWGLGKSLPLAEEGATLLRSGTDCSLAWKMESQGHSRLYGTRQNQMATRPPVSLALKNPLF